MLKEIKPAIFENLNDMYNDTFKTEYETDLLKNPLDSASALDDLRDYISEAVNLLMSNEADFISLLDHIRNFIVSEGQDFGHIFYCNTFDGFSYSGTGSWSVRLGTINRIIAMVSFQPYRGLPKYDKPSFSFLHDWGDNDQMIVDVYAVDFGKYNCIYRLNPRLFTVNDKMCSHVKWEYCQSYTDKDIPYIAEFAEYTN